MARYGTEAPYLFAMAPRSTDGGGNSCCDHAGTGLVLLFLTLSATQKRPKQKLSICKNCYGISVRCVFFLHLKLLGRASVRDRCVPFKRSSLVLPGQLCLYHGSFRQANLSFPFFFEFRFFSTMIWLTCAHPHAVCSIRGCCNFVHGRSRDCGNERTVRDVSGLAASLGDGHPDAPIAACRSKTHTIPHK